MSPATWIIVGATRGIGLEFVRQLLRRGERVIATVRSTSQASQLWTLTAGAAAPRVGSWCRMLECDVTVDESINVCFLFFFVSSSIFRPSPEGGRRLSSLVLFKMQVAPYFLHWSGDFIFFPLAEWLVCTF